MSQWSQCQFDEYEYSFLTHFWHKNVFIVFGKGVNRPTVAGFSMFQKAMRTPISVWKSIQRYFKLLNSIVVLRQQPCFLKKLCNPDIFRNKRRRKKAFLKNVFSNNPYLVSWWLWLFYITHPIHFKSPQYIKGCHLLGATDSPPLFCFFRDGWLDEELGSSETRATWADGTGMTAEGPCFATVTAAFFTTFLEPSEGAGRGTSSYSFLLAVLFGGLLGGWKLNWL